MQRIDSLLKHITPQKDERDVVVESVFLFSQISLQKKDIHVRAVKGVQKVVLSISGAQKTKLVLVKNELEKDLFQKGFILVL